MPPQQFANLAARVARWAVPVGLLLLGGCVLAPKGLKDERAAATRSARAFQYDAQFNARQLPDLPDTPTWRDVLRRAFLANGDLEAAYFDWVAALARVPQVATYPNTNLAPSFSYLFSGGRMKSWDRTTVNVGFDPMENLSFPTKVSQSGKVAFEQARAAGLRFEEAKFDLQRKVLTAYLDLALHEEKIRVQTENVSLLKLLADTAADRVRAGGSQQDLLRAQTLYRLADNELANLHAGHATMRAMLNAMLARPSDAPVGFPPTLPPPRPLHVPDDRLIAAAADRDPQLARMARDVAGRSDAVELARMAFIPDVNPMAAFTGSVSQSVGAMLILPTTIPEIRGHIEEARAMLRSSEAMLRQARNDRAASFVAALYALRNAERQVEVIRRSIRPQAEESLKSARQAYAAGQGSFTDLIEAQRTLLDVRLTLAEAHVEREKRLVELEAIGGFDVEALAPSPGPASTAPATLPVTAKAAAFHEGH